MCDNVNVQYTKYLVHVTESFVCARQRMSGEPRARDGLTGAARRAETNRGACLKSHAQQMNYALRDMYATSYSN